MTAEELKEQVKARFDAALVDNKLADVSGAIAQGVELRQRPGEPAFVADLTAGEWMQVFALIGELIIRFIAARRGTPLPG